MGTPANIPIAPKTDEQAPIGMSLEDYLKIPLERFELIEGEIVEKMPNYPEHENIGDILRDAIRDSIHKRGIGLISRERTFVVTDPEKSDWVKGAFIPDIMFVRQSRLDAYIEAHPKWLKEPFALIPDLVIEIVSVNDTNKEVREKVNRYLENGVPFVWVVDPRYRRVTIYRADGDPVTVLKDTDTLDGGDLIPGFSIDVAKLFE